MRIKTALLILCGLLLLAGCNEAEPLATSSEAALPTDGEYSSIEALSEAMGYPVKSLFTLPMGYKEVGYACEEGVAVIRYRPEAGEGIITFYMADPVRADYFPEGEDYEALFTHVRGDAEIAAMGMDEAVYRAVWQEGDYSYCILSDTGIAPSVFRMMIDDIA